MEDEVWIKIKRFPEEYIKTIIEWGEILQEQQIGRDQKKDYSVLVLLKFILYRNDPNKFIEYNTKK